VAKKRLVGGRNIVIQAFWLLASVGISVLGGDISQAQDVANSRDAASSIDDGRDESKLRAVDRDGKPVPIPPPPNEIANWIEAGDVRFEFYDPELTPRSFAGETQFEFKYRYDSRSNWKRKDQEGKPGIEIKIEYDAVYLDRNHRILLPQKLLRPDLFQHPLTLHEFDHVRISADPRLPRLLESMLKERNAVVTKVLDVDEDEFQGAPTKQDLARISQRLVKEASERVFQDFVAIVSSRYQELDRLTRYGTQPLTAEDRERVVNSPAQAPKVDD
jgi:hypothetical protein